MTTKRLPFRRMTLPNGSTFGGKSSAEIDDPSTQTSVLCRMSRSLMKRPWLGSTQRLATGNQSGVTPLIMVFTSRPSQTSFSKPTRASGET